MNLPDSLYYSLRPSTTIPPTAIFDPCTAVDGKAWSVGIVPGQQKEPKTILLVKWKASLWPHRASAFAREGAIIDFLFNQGFRLQILVCEEYARQHNNGKRFIQYTNKETYQKLQENIQVINNYLADSIYQDPIHQDRIYQLAVEELGIPHDQMLALRNFDVLDIIQCLHQENRPFSGGTIGSLNIHLSQSPFFREELLEVRYPKETPVAPYLINIYSIDQSVINAIKAKIELGLVRLENVTNITFSLAPTYVERENLPEHIGYAIEFCNFVLLHKTKIDSIYVPHYSVARFKRTLSQYAEHIHADPTSYNHRPFESGKLYVHNTSSHDHVVSTQNSDRPVTYQMRETGRVLSPDFNFNNPLSIRCAQIQYNYSPYARNVSHEANSYITLRSLLRNLPQMASLYKKIEPSVDTTAIPLMRT